MSGKTIGFIVSWVIALTLLVLVFSYTLKLTELKDFISLAESLKPQWIFLMALTEFGTYFSTASMYSAIMKSGGHKVHVGKLLTLNMQKLAVDQLIPTGGVGGYAVISQALRRTGATKNIAIAMVFLGLAAWYVAGDLTGAFSLWTLRSVPAAFHSALIVFIIYFSVSVVILVLLRAVRMDWLKKIKHRVPFASLRTFLTEMAETREFGMAEKNLFFTCILVQICLILFDAGTLAFACVALGHPLPYTSVLACYIFSSMAGTLSLLPGGIGVFEGGAITLLGFVGLAPEAALTATVLYRGFSLWLPLIPGIFFARSEIHQAHLRRTAK